MKYMLNKLLIIYMLMGNEVFKLVIGLNLYMYHKKMSQ